MEKYLFFVLVIAWFCLAIFSMVVRNWEVLLSSLSHLGVMWIAFYVGFRKGKEEV